MADCKWMGFARVVDSPYVIYMTKNEIDNNFWGKYHKDVHLRFSGLVNRGGGSVLK